jgi:HD-GYP domain-containing protein (c-di-GMP phosphodiesterase class II)
LNETDSLSWDLSHVSVLLEFLDFINGGPQPAVNDLLHRVLVKSRKLTSAEAGMAFIARGQGRKKRLVVASIQNDLVKIPEDALRLNADPSSIAGYVAASGERVRVDDVRKIPADRPYRFDPETDKLTGFRSKSVLAFPLKNYADEVIGVIQLINKRDGNGQGPIAFTSEDAALIQPVNHIVGGAIDRALMIERISEQNRRLKERSRLMARQRRQIANLKDQTEEAFQLSIRLLARAAELYDEDTGNHIVRVNEYSYLLAKRLGQPEAFCDEIRYSAQLHDVGKMSVDSAVLKKKGDLTPAERREMNLHPKYGHQILSQSNRLHMAADIALCHHEKWDGSGYPNGLKGDAIPLAARIVQLADVYDALRSPRPYKAGYTHEQAYKIITEGDERIDPRSHFDPKLVELFKKCHHDLDRVWSKLQD